jgi:AmpD protein
MVARPPSPPAAASTGGLRVGADGWIAPLAAPDWRIPSPNFDARPAGAEPVLLVVHSISIPPGNYGLEAVERLFTNRLTPAFLAGVLSGSPSEAPCAATGGAGSVGRVSAHFWIGRDGALTQFVSCADRAWHAGASSFEGRERCNDFSIGVELAGCDAEPFAPAQYRRLRALAAALCLAYPLRAVRGHDEIAPGRKTDPGPLFDWSEIARDPAAAIARNPAYKL